MVGGGGGEDLEVGWPWCVCSVERSVLLEQHVEI